MRQDLKNDGYDSDHADAKEVEKSNAVLRPLILLINAAPRLEDRNFYFFFCAFALILVSAQQRWPATQRHSQHATAWLIASHSRNLLMVSIINVPPSSQMASAAVAMCAEVHNGNDNIDGGNGSNDADGPCCVLQRDKTVQFFRTALIFPGQESPERANVSTQVRNSTLRFRWRFRISSVVYSAVVRNAYLPLHEDDSGTSFLFRAAQT